MRLSPSSSALDTSGVGDLVVGLRVSETLGEAVGLRVRKIFGAEVGLNVGLNVGDKVGNIVGVEELLCNHRCGLFSVSSVLITLANAIKNSKKETQILY